MGMFKSGVPNGTVSGDSRYFTPDNNWPNGSPGGGHQFWSDGWGATEESQKGGKMESGGGKMSKKMMGSKHGKCPFCG